MISVWLRTTVSDVTSVVAAIGASTAVDTVILVELAQATGAVYASVNGRRVSSGASNTADGNWHLLSVAWSGVEQEVAFYVDGVHLITKPMVPAGSALAANGPFCVSFGRRPNGVCVPGVGFTSYTSLNDFVGSMSQVMTAGSRGAHTHLALVAACSRDQAPKI